MYDKDGAQELKLIGDKLYFVKGKAFYTIDTKAATPTAVELKVNGDSSGATTYATDGTYLYYREIYGLLGKSRLSCCKLDGSEYRVMMEETNDPLTIACYGDYVYYYNEVNLAGEKNGLYRIRKQAGSTAEQVLSKSIKFAMNFVVVGNNVYFVDYRDQIQGDCHLYKFTIGSTTPERLD